MSTYARNSICVIIFFLSLLIAFTVTCRAGNLSLIEKRLKELDALNKQAVQQVVEIPRNGVINATIQIPSGNAVEKAKVKKLSISPSEPDSPFTIQVSSSPQRGRIMEVARQLRMAGISAFTSTPFQHNGQLWQRIFVGSYQTRMAADKANENLQREMFPKGFILNLPYSIQIGPEMTGKEAEVIDTEVQELQYLPYLSSGSKKGYVRVLLGAFKTELEAQLALDNLDGIFSEMEIVQR